MADPIPMSDAQAALASVTRKLSAVYGVDLSVGRNGESMIFVDSRGEAIVDPYDPKTRDKGVIAATADEIADGTFLKLYAARALYAALAARVLQEKA